MVTTGKKQENEKLVRPPIVVVMGHIDHGKTKILDWYRKSKIVESEAGGITQHIGAYAVEHKGKKITFIDTPGHEAFSKLRSRGARVADVAILVVAADEGVKPQTKEALAAIRENNLPFVVALNKIDKPEANPERVKQELAKENVLVESYGGKVPSVEVSAKAGENLDALLELVLLVAELENLQVDPAKYAEGVIVEAHLDPQRGITATLLVQDGTLRREHVMVLGRSVETIKIMEDFRGEKIDRASPSSPVLVAGLKEMPIVGDLFRSFGYKKVAEEFISSLSDAVQEKKPPREELIEGAAGERKIVFNVILKTDVVGSKEALEDSLKKFTSDTVAINVLKSEAGDIGESDVQLAAATNVVTIIGFKVRIDPIARELAEKQNIRIVTGEVIYDLLETLKQKIEEMLPSDVAEIPLGHAKILKVFRRTGPKQIVGGRVEDGVVRQGAKTRVKRNKMIVGGGSIIELQQNKQNVDEVQKGSEFGVMIDSGISIQEGDTLEIFEEKVTPRKL